MNDKKNKINNFLKEYVSYVIILIIVLLIKKYIVSPIKVNGESMMKTLHNGDIMILNIIDYRFHKIERFDIVVVKEEHEYLIKRVIGLPGEKITYKDNQLYINDKKVKDPYGSSKTGDFTMKVGKNKYFVMGDNRSNSMDSRVFGSFPKKSILGKTKLVLFPFSRFGTKK